MAPNAPRSLLAQVFLSPEERRLRAGWRILLQAILLLIFLTIGSILVLLGTALFHIDLYALPPLSLLDLLPTALAIVLAVWVARRLFDRRSFTRSASSPARTCSPTCWSGSPSRAP